jgi:hypothetical protein
MRSVICRIAASILALCAGLVSLAPRAWPRPNRSTGRAGVAAAVAASLLAQTVPSANASEGHGRHAIPDPNPSLPSTSQMTSGAAVGVSPSLVLGGSSGCYGQTDQPHASGHVAGTVNVVARTVCPTQDYVSVAQYRSRWYGWESWGSGSNSGYGKAQANASHPCAMGDIYTYLANSYHSGSGAGEAYTSNSAEFTCP